MLTYFDLTVLKQTEAALLAAKEQAEQASQAKSTFLASMSHELRTPLNAIIGYGEMLLEEAEDKDDAQLASDLLRIRNSGRHLLSLINDILDLSKIEAGRMELKLSEFALPPLLDDCMKTLEPIVDTDRVQLSVCAAPDLPVLTNDADKLRQVVINLLSNAAKFTHQGAITLRAHRDGHQVVIEVADTGVGIPADKQSLVFEAFWQIEGSTTQSRSGTGLGLGISQKLAHLMGGAITLQSEVGVGSIFSVSIDLALNQKASSQPC
jgi:signal transduction histidine kinase